MNRCKAFLESLKPGASAAALIHRPENIRWLTGYTGEGCAFIGMDAQVIITDFRYTEQAGRQAPECACLRTEAGLPERAHVKALCEKHGVKKLFVETDYLIYDDYHALEAFLPGIELVPLGGVPQTLRMIKDASEIECIRRAAAISCKAFENLLNNQEVNYKIPAGLPEGTPISHKTGEVDDTENDTAIIYTPYGDYIFCILSTNLTDTGSAVDHIREITAMVYDWFTRPVIEVDSETLLPLDTASSESGETS